MFAGDNRRLRIPVYTDAEQTQRKNLTGVTSAIWQLNDIPPADAGSQLLVQKTLGMGVSIVFDQDPVNGDVLVIIDQPDTEGFPAAYNYHEAEIIDAGGDKITILSGTVTMRVGSIS